MLWVSAQTAESSLFLFPGQKARVCKGLQKLILSFLDNRERDSCQQSAESSPIPCIDDVLTFILLTIVVSGGDFKTDCFKWWNKTLCLARSMRLNREDGDDDSRLNTTCSRGPTCACRSCDAKRLGISVTEAQEERRRAFWLIFCLDRHLALSFNSPLGILDDECELYCPLPDDAWESLSSTEPDASLRVRGPPTTISGTGLFEYFLPLMTILGDVIQLHKQKCHPRFGGRLQAEHDAATTLVEEVLANCERSIADLAVRFEVHVLDGAAVPGSQAISPHSGVLSPDEAARSSPPQASATAISEAGSGGVADVVVAPPRHAPSRRSARRRAQAQLVTAYSSFILHVLHVLLHGKWDAVSMLDNKDGWISSVGFMKCASHSIAASDAVSRILACDPELSFMPYLFGIYLLHGSFILLLFADRMPQVGLNESVERACEIIIRAHEVCVVTLSTEFQVSKFRASTCFDLHSLYSWLL